MMFDLVLKSKYDGYRNKKKTEKKKVVKMAKIEMFVSYSICFRLCLDNKISEIFPFFFCVFGYGDRIFHC